MASTTYISGNSGRALKIGRATAVLTTEEREFGVPSRRAAVTVVTPYKKDVTFLLTPEQVEWVVAEMRRAVQEEA
jgi:hypothetical protein